MPTISEPLAEGRSWTYARCRLAFQRGQIGEATFRVTLLGLGMSEQEAQAEIALARMELPQASRASHYS